MAKKLSKSDTTPEMEARDAELREKLAMKTSPHFTPGTWILESGRRGEILSILTCKCWRSEKMLRIRWEDGEIGYTKPRALNPNGIGHS